jgi:hypothetical protein
MSKPRWGANLGIQEDCSVGPPSVREQPVCGPGGIWCKGGVSSSQAWVGNGRTCRLDTGSQYAEQIPALRRLSRGRTPSGKHRKGESTDARHRGEPTRSSGEGPVMGLELDGPLSVVHFVCDKTTRSLFASLLCCSRSYVVLALIHLFDNPRTQALRPRALSKGMPAEPIIP